jgi:hypothetical protein
MSRGKMLCLFSSLFVVPRDICLKLQSEYLRCLTGSAVPACSCRSIMDRAFSPGHRCIAGPGPSAQAGIEPRFQRSAKPDTGLRAEGPAPYQPGAKPQELCMAGIRGLKARSISCWNSQSAPTGPSDTWLAPLCDAVRGRPKPRLPGVVDYITFSVLRMMSFWQSLFSSTK